ncbi:MAG: hypothetical protein H7833_01100 [Magnetococcus sp. DMHC-1]|nr:hypothetical protein [Magnetococcales bacterium]
MMNNKVDFANLRDKDLEYANTNVGDYKGGHLSAGLALTRRLWIDGSIWSRVLQTPQDPLDGLSWQRSIQYQMTINLGKLPALGIRFTQWGNWAKEVNRKTSSITLDGTAMEGTSVRNVRLEKPGDEQTQLDLIGTWNIGPRDSFSLFIGGGTSQIGFKKFVANMGRDCEYSLDSPSKYELTGQLVSGDAGICQLIGFHIVDLEPKYPGPDMLNMRYKATYHHFGGTYLWFTDRWRFRAGARYERVNRQMDEDLKNSGIPYYDSNTIISTEFGYKPFKSIGFFLRTQMMEHQLLSEVPFSYNKYTSSRFNRQYGLISMGIQGGF